MSEKTLLIVDDDAPLRKRLARAMEQDDFIVETAESVREGIRLAASFCPKDRKSTRLNSSHEQ